MEVTGINYILEVFLDVKRKLKDQKNGISNFNIKMKKRTEEVEVPNFSGFHNAIAKIIAFITARIIAYLRKMLVCYLFILLFQFFWVFDIVRKSNLVCNSICLSKMMKNSIQLTMKLK